MGTLIVVLLVLFVSLLFCLAVGVMIKRLNRRTTPDSSYDPDLEYRSSLPPNVRVGIYQDPYSRYYDPFYDPVVVIEENVTVPDATGFSGFSGGDSGGGGASSDWGTGDSGSCDSGSSSDSGGCDAGGGS